MKTIGLLGGMSWESTAIYYKTINTLIKERLGGLHSAKILLYSVDFAEIEAFARTKHWAKAGKQLSTAALNLEKAGANCIVLCTNSMHKVADDISVVISVPFLHICDETARSAKIVGKKKLGLLGTKFTMEDGFYVDRMQKQGLEIIVPDLIERDEIHRIIFQELCLGKLLPESRQKFFGYIEELKNKGAEAVILGCTEIGMLIEAKDSSLPLLDTTIIHCKAAVNFSAT